MVGHLLDPMDDTEVQEWQEFLRRRGATQHRWRVGVAVAVLMVAGIFVVLFTAGHSSSTPPGDLPASPVGAAPGAQPVPGYPPN
jgi:hypothetical protein